MLCKYKGGGPKDHLQNQSYPSANVGHSRHTFLATVEGQASVVKGDSLVLLDDANSYWWLVRVLKTEDVGYIPAENIETPYERLARLNKHRNIDLAAATLTEKQLGEMQSREKLKGAIAAKGRSARQGSSEGSEESGARRVVFAPPTYVDHPGVTWSSDEESSEGEHEPDEAEGQEDEDEDQIEDEKSAQEVMDVDQSMDEMEPDDGVEWADDAAERERQKALDQRAQAQVQQNGVQPKSNNPFASPQLKSNTPADTVSMDRPGDSTTSLATSNGNPILDPAVVNSDTRRVTATPAIANDPLLPSAVVQQSQRKVSNQSTSSVYSAISASSSVRSSTPTSITSPEDNTKKIKKARKGKDEGGGEKKKKGLLGGLFSRNKNSKPKGISSGDTRSSEESTIEELYSEGIVSGRDTSTGNLTPQQQAQHPQSGVSTHSLKLQQQDQARMQSYTNKYLRSPSSGLHSPSNAEAAAAVAQSAAAMRLTASMNGTANGRSARPSSIIVSPNPDGPPLLNVIRIFAGTRVQSEASFKTALVNETTSAGDLIRQAVQRFHLVSSAGEDTVKNYYITVKDFDGSELELSPTEKPLVQFQNAVARWTSGETEADELGKILHERLGAITPTVNRESVSSISSVLSLSNHPAIKKLGMDWEDDSAVKLYLNRRVPGGQEETQQEMRGLVEMNHNGESEPQSEFSSYNTGLSTVHESPNANTTPDGTLSPTVSQTGSRNPHLTISTSYQGPAERYLSPSAKFTLQLLLHPSDLPDGVAFDPSSDSLVPRPHMPSPSAEEPRMKLFTVPRNANVVDVIEQGLERFGVQEGVVDGGDEVEDKVGKRRSMTRVRYCLGVIIDGKGMRLFSVYVCSADRP